MPEDQNHKPYDTAFAPSDSLAPRGPSVSVQPTVTAAPKSYRGLWLAAALVALFMLGTGLVWALQRSRSPVITMPADTSGAQRPAAAAAASQQAQGLQLDTSNNYGDKYANGILPVGDGKYETTAAKTGYIYACSGYAQNIGTSQGGADKRGTWFVNNNTQYDTAKKPHVAGSVIWKPTFSDTLSGGNRIILSNDLPNHPTGIFPIATADPAYAYDRNPNSIRSQTLSYALPASPVYGSPHCMGGEAGIMLSGVALFNAFDAGGRDAGAWEVQDGCSGHPQMSGEYHYHTLSSCIKDSSISTVIGFALDGFPITGPKLSTHNVLTTANLDECHGIVSQITLDGKKVTTYHYVMTQDFPYSISCFRAQPIQNGPPAGQTNQPPNAPLQ